MTLERLRPMAREICFAMCLVATNGTWIGAALAGSSDARPTLCTAPEVTIFSCVTKERRIVSFCLSPTTKLYIRNKESTGRLTSDDVRRAREAVVGTNPHGDSIVLQLVGASQTETLFVSQDYYDLDGGTLIISNGRDSIERCLLASKRVDAGFLMLNGKETNVGLGALANVGLANHWVDPPKWPGT